LAIRVLFFNLENYMDFAQESQNYLLRLPMIKCGLEIKYSDHAHQRDLKTLGRKAADENALAAVREFKPDVVVYAHTWRYGDLSPAFFRTVRTLGPKIVSCIWDSFIYPSLAEIQLFQQSDCVLVADALNTYLRLRVLSEMTNRRVTVGLCTGQYFIPDSDDPPAREEKIYDVTILGSLFGERLTLAQHLEPKLRERGIKLHTMGGMYNESQKELGYRETWVDWDNYAKIIRQSKICLSSQNDIQRLRIKGKVFEIAARGTLCISDLNGDSRRMLPADIFPLYSNFDDCYQKICHFLENDEERIAVERNAQKWVRENFDPGCFYKSLLNYLIFGEGKPPTPPFLDKEFEMLMEHRELMLPALADLVSTHIELFTRQELFPAAAPAGSTRPA
jgi:hypothetical protein